MSFNRRALSQPLAGTKAAEEVEAKKKDSVLGKRKRPSEKEKDVNEEKSVKEAAPLKESLLAHSFVLEFSNSQAAAEVHGDKPILFQGKSYEMFTHDFPITPEAVFSCRGRFRETILVDMQSEVLKKYAERFLASLSPDSAVGSQEKTQPLEGLEEVEEKNDKSTAIPEINLCSPDILQKLVHFVCSHLKGTTEAKLKDSIQQEQEILAWKDSKSNVPLEWFLKIQQGFCRHHCLFSGYLLATLLEQQAARRMLSFAQIQGGIYRYRGPLPFLNKDKKPRSHAVVIYEAENKHRYLIDSAFKALVVDLTELTPATQAKLLKHYQPYDGLQFIARINKIYDKLKIPEKTLTVHL